MDFRIDDRDRRGQYEYISRLKEELKNLLDNITYEERSYLIKFLRYNYEIIDFTIDMVAHGNIGDGSNNDYLLKLQGQCDFIYNTYKILGVKRHG